MAFFPGPQSGLSPALEVGGRGSVLGETVNPISSASLSKTSNDPKFILYPIYYTWTMFDRGYSPST